MKKSGLIIALLLAGVGINQMKAQDDYNAGIFKHLSVGVSVSTLGYGVDVASDLGSHLMLRAGVDFVPNYTFNTDVDAEAGNHSTTVDLEASMKRTQYSLLLNYYPSKKSSFFLTGGAYFGGKDLVTIDARSDEMKQLYDENPGAASLVIDKYSLPIEPDGSVKGGISVSGFRPYLGLGFGRLVPHKRVGFMVEFGVQFHGTPKVYSSAGDIEELTSNYDSDDDLSKIVDQLTVYPVLKFRLCGRIF